MMRSSNLHLPLAISAAALVAACTSGDSPATSASGPQSQVTSDASAAGFGDGGMSNGPGATTDGGTGGSPSLPDIKRATRPLQWKRYAAFESDLSQALALDPSELCLEFGTTPCIRNVHLSPLGGHDPFGTGLLESPQEPLASTPTVVERVVLKACLARIEKDRAASASAVVFKGLDWSSATPAADSEPVKGVITELYRRLLSRNPDADELSVASQLAVDEAGAPVSVDTFAATACLLVGTSTEFIFF